MTKIFRILACLILLSNLNLVFSAPVFEGVKKALNIGWKKMPESERANHRTTQEAHLHDRNRRATSAQQSAEQARAQGNHVGEQKHANEALQRQASAKRIEGNIAMLDSNKPLRMKDGMSGKLHRTDFKPRKGH